ncbi:MAG TPA: beta-ketoacyl-ACP synthase III, partial [Planctomycetota bacterium]|nr:beta-ketoacyl-ACP synthase III [Planctomycetota bacterium]
MSVLQSAAIYGTGAYTPQKVLTNDDFAKTLDTSDEWITTRTGIKERRIASPEEATSDLCLKASQAAIENAGIKAADLDMIIIGTVSPDFPFPSAACVLQQKLGVSAKHIPAFDVSAACSGFIYGLATAQAFIASGMAKHVLIVGAEVLSRMVDYKDRATCILFGDGAGATVVGPARQDGPSHKLLSTRIYSDGSGVPLLCMLAGGSARPASHVTIDEKLHYIRLDGREVFRFGVTTVVELITDAMQRHNLKKEDIGAIVPHQANIRIIESAAERLGLPLDLFITNIDKYGNTSAASVPIALDEANRARRLPKGKPVIMLAFG